MDIIYKVWFKDRQYNIGNYPVTIKKKNIYELCEWMNMYTSRWSLEALSVDIIDIYNERIGNVCFLPTELSSQCFITTPSERLLAYYEFSEVGV